MNLAKFFTRFCKIPKISGIILERFGTCNDIHTLQSTGLKVIRTIPQFTFKILQEHVRNLHLMQDRARFIMQDYA